jgi:hypothetical protein
VKKRMVETLVIPDPQACAQVASLEFMAPAAAKRVDADMLSKLLFQQAIRSTPLSIEEIAGASDAASTVMQG